jgi:hypothetical protein
LGAGCGVAERFGGAGLGRGVGRNVGRNVGTGTRCSGVYETRGAGATVRLGDGVAVGEGVRGAGEGVPGEGDGVGGAGDGI